MSKSCHRKMRVMDQSVQGALLKRTCLHWFSFLVLSICITSGLGILTGDLTKPIADQLSRIAASNFWPFITLVAMLPMFLVDTLRLSSRFAGPMVRLRRSMDNLADHDDTSPLIFREGDFWKASADSYNSVVDRYMMQQDRIAELEQQLAEARGQVSYDDASQESLEQVEKNVARLGK